MNNYLLKIEYDGTKFVGWQRQKNGISVQQRIEETLKKILKLKIKIVGSGRTDKGVHAIAQFANFKTNHNRKKFFLRGKTPLRSKTTLLFLQIYKSSSKRSMVYSLCGTAKIIPSK